MLKNVIGSASLAILLYLSGSFVNMTFDPGKWPEGGRFSMVVLWFIGTWGVIGYNQTTKNFKD